MSNEHEYAEYASPAWAGLTQYLSDQIESIQKRALKIIFPSLCYEDALSIHFVLILLWLCMFNINKWVCGLDFRRFSSPVFDPPRRALSGGGGEVFNPNEFCFCLNITCNETENSLDGSIRKDTGHLSDILSRAMVNYWKVKCSFSRLLSIQSKATKALLLCLRHIWFEFGEK